MIGTILCRYHTYLDYVFFLQIHFLRSILPRTHTDRFPDDVLKKLRQNRNCVSCEKTPQERKKQESQGFLQELQPPDRMCFCQDDNQSPHPPIHPHAILVCQQDEDLNIWEVLGTNTWYFLGWIVCGSALAIKILHRNRTKTQFTAHGMMWHMWLGASFSGLNLMTLYGLSPRDCHARKILKLFPLGTMYHFGTIFKFDADNTS